MAVKSHGNRGRGRKFDHSALLEAWHANIERGPLGVLVGKPQLSMRSFAEVYGLSLRHLRRVLNADKPQTPLPSPILQVMADENIEPPEPPLPDVSFHDLEDDLEFFPSWYEAMSDPEFAKYHCAALLAQDEALKKFRTAG
jgi:hypothetical protein